MQVFCHGKNHTVIHPSSKMSQPSTCATHLHLKHAVNNIVSHSQKQTQEVSSLSAVIMGVLLESQKNVQLAILAIF